MNNASNDVATYISLIGANFASRNIEHRVSLVGVTPSPAGHAREDASVIGDVAYSLGGLLALCGFRNAMR